MKAGMTKVSVLYPNGADKNFDMDYYLNTHIPMVGGLLGDALKGATVEKGHRGEVPGADATVEAMGNIYFESHEAFGNAFGKKKKKIMVFTV